MKRTVILLQIVLLVNWVASYAQVTVSSLNKYGGVYCVYPESIQQFDYPIELKPFYISHYGRHGSRYLEHEDDYNKVLEILEKAQAKNALTSEGLKTLGIVEEICSEAKDRAGELTSLGKKQQQLIAKRMCENFPEIFSLDSKVTAISTPYMRCAHSMFSFIKEINSLYPNLDISFDSSLRNKFLNYRSPESQKHNTNKNEWFLENKKFRSEKTSTTRIIDNLFCDSLFVRQMIDQEAFIWGLFWMAVDQQNCDTQHSLINIFSPKELSNMWESSNYNFYVRHSSYPLASNYHESNAIPLLNRIIEDAEQYIGHNQRGATLRFGHDTMIAHLTALIKIEGCWTHETNPYKLKDSYRNYEITPMAANIQIVFFKNKEDEIYVQLRLNEKPVKIDLPCDNSYIYNWKDLKQSFLDKINQQILH